MANSVDLMRLANIPTQSSTPDRPLPGGNLSFDLVPMAEKLFHKLTQPEQIRARLSDVLDLVQDRLDQVIITPAERQAAVRAEADLALFLRGGLADRGQVLVSARNLTTVLGKAGDLPLSRAVNAGVNALLKRQMAH